MWILINIKLQYNKYWTELIESKLILIRRMWAYQRENSGAWWCVIIATLWLAAIERCIINDCISEIMATNSIDPAQWIQWDE